MTLSSSCGSNSAVAVLIPRIRLNVELDTTQNNVPIVKSFSVQSFNWVITRLYAWCVGFPAFASGVSRFDSRARIKQLYKSAFISVRAGVQYHGGMGALQGTSPHHQSPGNSFLT